MSNEIKEPKKTTVEDFDGYYRKFFKREIDLPDPLQQASDFVSDLAKKNNFEIPDNLKKSVYLFFKNFNLTLREIKILMRVFYDSFESERERDLFDTYVSIFFICLYLKDKEDFQKIKNKKFDFNNFISFEKTKFGGNKTRNLNYGLGIVASSFLSNEQHKNLEQFETQVQKIYGVNSADIEHVFGRASLAVAHPPAYIVCKEIGTCIAHKVRLCSNYLDSHLEI